MATLNIKAIELAELIKMKNEGRVAEAWDFLGSKGDAYVDGGVGNDGIIGGWGNEAIEGRRQRPWVRRDGLEQACHI